MLFVAGVAGRAWIEDWEFKKAAAQTGPQASGAVSRVSRAGTHRFTFIGSCMYR